MALPNLHAGDYGAHRQVADREYTRNTLERGERDGRRPATTRHRVARRVARTTAVSTATRTARSTRPAKMRGRSGGRTGLSSTKRCVRSAGADLGGHGLGRRGARDVGHRVRRRLGPRGRTDAGKSGRDHPGRLVAGQNQGTAAAAHVTAERTAARGEGEIGIQIGLASRPVGPATRHRTRGAQRDAARCRGRMRRCPGRQRHRLDVGRCARLGGFGMGHRCRGEGSCRRGPPTGRLLAARRTDRGWRDVGSAGRLSMPGASRTKAGRGIRAGVNPRGGALLDCGPRLGPGRRLGAGRWFPGSCTVGFQRHPRCSGGVTSVVAESDRS